MGVTIDRAHLYTGVDGEGTVDRGVAAGRKCLEGSDAASVRVLINIGVYRDSNIVEPAVAALVQKRLGLGLRYETGTDPVFSFDVINGPCGWLSAVQTAAALLSSSSGRCLVIAGDGHPGVQRRHPFPYATTGAAALLSFEPGATGFGAVHTLATSARPALHGYVDLSTMGTRGRETITIDDTATGTDDLVKMAIEVAQRCIASEDVNPEQLALVASQPCSDFAFRVGEELGIDEVHAAPGGFGQNPHTAAPLHAYHAASKAGVSPRRDLLFVTAGAGPVVSACLYRRPAAITSGKESS
jgi:3-oxoacyl-[acyl-carrier-protein] synthase III